MKRAIRGLVALMAALGVIAPAAQASLSVPTGGPAQTYTSMSTFDQAAGGGFSHITWDSLAVNGSDPGSTAIEPGTVATVSRSALEPWGLELGPEIAVANDGFHSANPNVNFTPYSRPNVWAPFNSNTAELDVVSPAPVGSSPVPAESRGVGVELLGVTSSGTSVAYYNGDIPLLTQAVPAGATFAGALFPDPVVTRVVITLGTAPIFDFDGSHVTPTLSATDFVAADDVVLAEPAPARPAVAATAGVPVTGVLDTFTESNPSATPHATIDWGDGATTAGAISPSGGETFVVSGDHAYAATGTYTAQVTVDDASGPEQTQQAEITVGPRATTTAVSCTPAAVAVSASTSCTATVSDVTAGAPTAPGGVVSFGSPTPGAAFPQAGACVLGASPIAGVSSCAVQFTAGQLPPRQAHLTAAYTGDGTHAASSGSVTLAVGPQRCTLKLLSRRLRARGIAVLVTCDARTTVQITGQARAKRTRRSKALSLRFGSVRSAVTAGRPTVLVVKAAPGVLPAVRAALHRHRRVSLKLTLTAASRGIRTSTTARVSELRLP